MDYHIATRNHEKLAVVLNVFRTVQTDRGGRFLNRTEHGWEAVTDEEVIRQKISQALRDESRRMFKPTSS